MGGSFDKYRHYENSVQTPEEHVQIFDRMYFDIRKSEALSLREDFCGTFMISCEWVRSHPKRVAIGVDLDPEPLAYGLKSSYRKLNPDQKKRIRLLREDVTSVKRQKVDVIGAGNFSFYIFKTREQMRRYFEAARASLHREGIFVLEMAGGPGFIITAKEQKTYRVPGLGRFTYYWDQKSFDPVTHHGVYAIHFKDRHGRMHRDAFVYDWRVWTIPEIREIMLEAGFASTQVYWEDPGPDGSGNGVYLRSESGDNAYAWIAFVVGIK
ncbi:class I SAM-dependent methyltransferase [bacterium]|jgi:hypothetical protein|nr:class I SAM-dependent methyltransferase [bacterium]